MKAMSFNNVTTDEEVTTHMQTRGIKRSNVNPHALLEPVIAKLAMLYPTWTFKGSGHMSMGNDSVWLYSFAISCDDELLGKIERRYEGRDYQICVTNDRIKDSLERGTFYKTKASDKAIAKVKKMFNPKTTQEVANASQESAAKVAHSAQWNKTREKDDAYDIVRRAAIKYVMGAGFDMFTAYVKNNYPAQEYELIKLKHETADNARKDLETIFKVQSVIAGTERGTIVTSRGGTYVVAGSDNIEICDNNTLPEWVRGRLGMLKLIEPSQFLSEMGMRSSANTFVIIEPENLTTVTEGETK